MSSGFCLFSLSYELTKIHGNKVLAFIIEHSLDVDPEEELKLLENQVASDPEMVNRLFQPANLNK